MQIKIPTLADTIVSNKGRYYGAGDRTRTGTLSPAVDFESTTSTNSITPAGARFIIQRCGEKSKENRANWKKSCELLTIW